MILKTGDHGLLCQIIEDRKGRKIHYILANFDHGFLWGRNLKEPTSQLCLDLTESLDLIENYSRVICVFE